MKPATKSLAGGLLMLLALAVVIVVVAEWR